MSPAQALATNPAPWKWAVGSGPNTAIVTDADGEVFLYIVGKKAVGNAIEVCRHANTMPEVHAALNVARDALLGAGASDCLAAMRKVEAVLEKLVA